jgi:hypothetical protein
MRRSRRVSALLLPGLLVAAVLATASPARLPAAGYPYRTSLPMLARDAPAVVAPGTWGGGQVTMQVTASGATIEFSCAHATIDEPLVLDSARRFDASGVFVREHGGPIREDETPDAHPARFTGAVDGETMSLTIVLADDGSRVGTYVLVHGEPGRPVKCL